MPRPKGRSVSGEPLPGCVLLLVQGEAKIHLTLRRELKEAVGVERLPKWGFPTLLQAEFCSILTGLVASTNHGRGNLQKECVQVSGNPTFGWVSELAIWRKARTLPAACAFSRKCRVPRWVRPGKPDIEKPREP